MPHHHCLELTVQNVRSRLKQFSHFILQSDTRHDWQPPSSPCFLSHIRVAAVQPLPRSLNLQLAQMTNGRYSGRRSLGAIDTGGVPCRETVGQVASDLIDGWNRIELDCLPCSDMPAGVLLLLLFLLLRSLGEECYKTQEVVSYQQRGQIHDIEGCLQPGTHTHTFRHY